MAAARKSRGSGTIEAHGRTYRAHYFKLDPASPSGFVRVCENTGIRCDGSDPDDSRGAANATEAKVRARKRADLWLEERSAPYRRFIEHGRFAMDREKLMMVARGELAKADGIVAAKARDIESAVDRLPAYTLEEAWSAYDEHAGPQKRATPTHKNYNQWYHQFAEWMKEKHPEVKELRQTNAVLAREYLNYDRQRVSGSTYNRHLNALSLIWRVLSSKEIDGTPMFPKARLGANPFAFDKATMSGARRVKLEKDERPHRRRDLTTDEISRLLLSTHGEWRILIATGFYTGLRLGDCINIRRSNFDLATGTITVRSRKTDVETVTAIHPRLREIIDTETKGRESERTDDYLMPTIAKTYNTKDGPSDISKKLGRIFASCGIETSIKENGKRARPHATFHSLRHAYDTQLERAHVGLKSRQSLMGHSTAAMTEYYTHADSAAALALPDVLEDEKSVSIRNFTEATAAIDKLSLEDLIRIYRRLEFRIPKRHLPKDRIM